MIRAKQEAAARSSSRRNESSHQRDFAGFREPSTTRQPELAVQSRALRELCRLCGGEPFVEREVTQLFDPEAGVFLADRFVRGICPRCGTPDQYVFSCEKCQSTYAATDLKEPRSTLTGATPELRSAKHFFVQIEALHDFLAEWTQTASIARSSKLPQGHSSPNRSGMGRLTPAPTSLQPMRGHLVRMVRSPDLHGATRYGASHAGNFDGCGARRTPKYTSRQGHHLFHICLAGHAQKRGVSLPSACRSTHAHGQRAKMSKSKGTFVIAGLTSAPQPRYRLTIREQARTTWTTSSSTRRVRTQGERRSGRQSGQSRQPQRALRS